MFRRIVTHNDFDGLVSGALCAWAYNIDTFFFTGPRSISESRIAVTSGDIVCDLPYPLECGLWFDHHPGNAEELTYRNINLTEIPGRFASEPSCARVVMTYLAEEKSLPGHFADMVAEADIIDAFAYTSIEDWRSPTPGKLIENTLKLHAENRRERDTYMADLIHALRDHSLEDVAELDQVREWSDRYQAQEEQMIEQIRQDAGFLPDDVDREIVVIDLTCHNRQPVIVKNLAYLIFPDALGVIEIKNRFHGTVKSNDLSFSMSLSLNLNGKGYGIDVGEIMRQLNIGDGHQGAGAGVLPCRLKDEMQRKKVDTLKHIMRIWRTQSHGRLSE